MCKDKKYMIGEALFYFWITVQIEYSPSMQIINRDSVRYMNLRTRGDSLHLWPIDSWKTSVIIQHMKSH